VNEISNWKHPHRVGKWLPADQHVLEDWLAALIHEVAARPAPLHPVIEAFKALIEGDAQVYMLFHQMFEEVPTKPPYNKDPTGAPQVRNYHLMLKLFNAIMTRAPEYNETGLVGFPINAILDWPMGTGGGFTAFLNAKVNARFRAMLDEWARFLVSKDSTYVLNDDPIKGWFGRDAMKDMPNFDKTFVCDPAAPHHGFISWDDFFTREFRPGMRPVASPDDDSIIVNACESAPYRIAQGVHARDRFWIKAQPYSLQHMLADDPLAPQFDGGTVYQAFLSALSYHRWHSPVSGTVVKTYVQPGTYYSETPAEGFGSGPAGPDPSGPNDSQGYITEVAARAMIFIEADNPDIELMCVMPVGMAEVSTCDINVYEGQHVKKGDQLGMFHFGGSTHCLIFRPGVNLTFDMHGQTPGLDSKNLPVNAKIATVG
jgi:phosphatidylserine decarboxylase